MRLQHHVQSTPTPPPTPTATPTHPAGQGVNLIDDVENSADAHTLGILFGEFGFEGAVMTDWAGIRVPNASAAAFAGTTTEMPTGSQYQYLPQFIANGSLPIAVIDGLAVRVLTAAAAIGLLDDPPSPLRNASSVVTTPAHVALARELAEQSTVLLKNVAPAGAAGARPLLPLNLTALAASGRGILVLGDEGTVVGCGSGQQVTPYVITPAAGLYAYINGPNTSRPVNCTFMPDTDLFQDGVPCVTTASLADCCATCTAVQSCAFFTYLPGATCPGQPNGAGQCFLKPNDSGYRPHAGLTSGACAPLPPGRVPITYDAGTNSTTVAALASAADVVIVVVAATGCEGSDRPNLSLAPGFDAMVAHAAASNPATVVVTRCGGACLMPWLGDVPSVLQQGLAGQEAGAALARLLFGAVSPSGKLPLSFPASEDDTWIQDPAQYPGLPGADGWQHAAYSEGLEMGYRWYDARALQPLFPFGHGLSYTTFAYSGLRVNCSSLARGAAAGVSFAVANTGSVDGAEVAQLYVEYPPGAGEPPRLLRGVAKVAVRAGGPPAAVNLTLAYDDLAVWGAPAAPGGWSTVPGVYTLRVGASSRDLRLSAALTVE